MTPPSPLLLSGSLATFTIKAGGQQIPSTFQVISIDTFNAVNRLPRAHLTLYDGSPAEANFPISNLDTFLPGKDVSISAGYGQQQSVIFTGVIVSQSIQIDQTSASKLIVEISDQAMAMTLERRNAVFGNTTDSNVIQNLISSNGLTADVASTNTVYEDLVQYYATDWDMMVMRAELNGFVAITEAGKITVKAPDTTAAPVLEITYGDSILELEAEMNAATQYASSAIKSYSWDEGAQQMIQSGPGTLEVEEPGNVSSDELAKTFAVQNYPQQTSATIPSAALQDWSTAELLKSKLSKICGSARFQGSALAKTGSMIQLSGLGNRFNGPAFVSAVRHSITDGRWITAVTFGLEWPWFASEAPRIPAPGASGQLPPVQGLQTGKVKQVAADPAGEFRVQIDLPILGSSAAPVWARLGSFYASNKIGAVFYPEVGDEVIVAFMNNDPRSPVIVGSVYSKQLTPPYPPEAANNMKAIVSRTKLELTFDEQNKALEIKTPGKRSVRLDDNAGTITISDPDNNTITLSSAGITIDSAKDLILKAKANVTISAGSALSMSANTNATLQGKQVSITATGSLQAHGGTASLTASGATTITGAMVSIN